MHSGIIEITRRETFSSSHRLHSSELSDEENRKLFGKCNWANGHGHNYVMEVTVKGPVDPKTGILINLVDLKHIIIKCVKDKVDHRHLNFDVPEFGKLNPTAENMAIVFWQWLKPELKDKLYRIKLYETENNSVEYYG